MPPEIEQSYTAAQSGTEAGMAGRIYKPPPSFPANLTIDERIHQDLLPDEASEKKYYEPVWHEGTGVDEEEALYRSSLVPIEEALQKLRGSVMADVVRRAWEAVQLRVEMERSR